MAAIRDSTISGIGMVSRALASAATRSASWSRTQDGAPFVYDFSFGYDGDFSKQAEAHKAGEKLMQALNARLGEKLALKDVHKWLGSKVRVLLDQPL